MERHVRTAIQLKSIIQSVKKSVPWFLGDNMPLFYLAYSLRNPGLVMKKKTKKKKRQNNNNKNMP